MRSLWIIHQNLSAPWLIPSWDMDSMERSRSGCAACLSPSTDPDLKPLSDPSPWPCFPPSTHLHGLALQVQPLFAHPLVEVVVFHEGFLHDAPGDRHGGQSVTPTPLRAPHPAEPSCGTAWVSPEGCREGTEPGSCSSGGNLPSRNYFFPWQTKWFPRLIPQPSRSSVCAHPPQLPGSAATEPSNARDLGKNSWKMDPAAPRPLPGRCPSLPEGLGTGTLPLQHVAHGHADRLVPDALIVVLAVPGVPLLENHRGW